MTQTTPVCALPTKKFPQGRTGRVAGYVAHRRAGQIPCRPCVTAYSAKCAARKANLSEEDLKREKARIAENARRRWVSAAVCTEPTPDHPKGRRGTVAGFLLHLSLGQQPCKPCRVAAPAYELACQRPTPKYPNGRTGTRSGYHAHGYAGEEPCDACMAGNTATVKQERRADRTMSLRSNLRYKYRLSMEAYEALLDAQGGACAICKVDTPTDVRTSRFHVDHDHACCPGTRSCGKCVRGLLCHACNTALGNFQDDPERLRAALAYLTSHKS